MNRIARTAPATVIACVALAVALGGTSYAALVLPADSVGSKQLKNRSIDTVDIAKRTISAVKGKSGPQGPAGPQGPPGSPLRPAATSPEPSRIPRSRPMLWPVRRSRTTR